MPEDDDNLIAFARGYFANDFPNPDRVDCPSHTSLAEMVDTKRLPDATLRAHLLGCSECFEYLNARLTARPVEIPPPPAWGRIVGAVTRSWRPLAATALLVVSCLFIWAVWRGVNRSFREGVAPPARSGDELSAGVGGLSPTPSATVTPATPEPVMTYAANTPPASNPRPEKRRSPALAAVLVRIDLRGRLTLRGSGDKDEGGPIRIPSARNNLSIKLPEESPKGEYTVSLVDAFGESVIAAKAKSRDGKYIALLLDMRGLPSRSYRLCISHADGVPFCYPLAVSGGP